MNTMQSIERVLTIDPSIRALGWAIFEIDHTRKQGRYVTSGVIKKRKGEWTDRLDEIVIEIKVLVSSFSITHVLIEQPRVYTSSKGQAASNSQSILKLTAIVFAIRQSCMMLTSSTETKKINIIIDLVPVNRWMGNRPKRVTQRRVKEHWRVLPKDHNECDAVGIGDWFIRKSLRYTPMGPKSKRGRVVSRVRVG